jgi:hypothetical protein
MFVTLTVSKLLNAKAVGTLEIVGLTTAPPGGEVLTPDSSIDLHSNRAHVGPPPG